MRQTTLRDSARYPALVAIALVLALAPSLTACSAADPELDEWELYGVEGPFSNGDPLGKADSANVPGPWVNTNTKATQVWTARNKWEDTDTTAARAAGIAWPADSGLNWDEKYARWVEGMPRQAGNNTYYDTFTLTTPWTKTVPAPKLECAEMGIFLRVTFASWYELPFFMTAVDGQGTRVYFGHFGARTKTQRYKNTPKYGYSYKDYSNWTQEKIDAQGWPEDAKLRERGLHGGGDDMPFIEPGARAGAYFDEIYLNKRTGHFMRLLLAYFGSMHLASSRNTFNLKPDAIQEGDVLIERWQRKGIGHTLIVKSVQSLDGGLLEAQLASGSMPRRQPKWEDAVASKYYFTLEETGGEGTNSDGDEYAKLGGGIKRFRVTKNIGGYWNNTWMNADEASWISDTDYARIKVRPATFEQILGEVDPEQLRDALLAMIEDKRNHLRQYPASCSARGGREDAFEDLYELMETEFGTTRAQVDEDYRILEDYVFQKLEYTVSKTCCWNSSTAAMFQIIMDYNESLMAEQCQAPEVFKCTGGGYQVFESYAQQTGRGHLWKAWSEDESCPQRDVTDDTVLDTTEIDWCTASAGGGGGGGGGGCADDGNENDDHPNEATNTSAGTHSGLMICSGDDDYFSFDVPNGGSLTVSINFDHSEGDLDMAIFSGSQELDSSESTGNSESVSVSGGGSYIVQVYGYSGAQAGYSLTASM